MISCREICKLYFWCNDITLFSSYDFYNALKSIFATDVVGCLCQLEVSNFGFAQAPKIPGPALFEGGGGFSRVYQPNAVVDDYRISDGCIVLLASVWFSSLLEWEGSRTKCFLGEMLDHQPLPTNQPKHIAFYFCFLYVQTHVLPLPTSPMT